MHPFGGSQVCPRCSKAVYAAEQVMGPGRKLYHKPCLSCMTCKKRLDSYSLVEHDQEPYCKSCYTKSFSVRDLRQANLPVRERSVSPNSASPPSPVSNISSIPPSVPSPTRKPNTGTFPLPRLKPTHSLTSPTSFSFSQPPRFPDEQPFSSDKYEPTPEEETGDQVPPLKDQSLSNRPIPVPDHTTHQSSSSMSSPLPVRAARNETKRFSNPSFSTFSGRNNNTTAAALNLLEQEGISPLVQTATGTRYGAALGGTMSINMTGTSNGGSPRKWGAETPLCPKCSKRVYFAEQAKAVGQTWHKNCLRCRECNALLDSNRLRDHNNAPYCVRCYSKLHGPQGSGYALLGKAGS